MRRSKVSWAVFPAEEEARRRRGGRHREDGWADTEGERERSGQMISAYGLVLLNMDADQQKHTSIGANTWSVWGYLGVPQTELGNGG